MSSTWTRQPSAIWRAEVPGTRWFRADLHVHTVDDGAGGRAKMPPGVTADRALGDPLRAYARAFLRGAIAARVHVLGLTPHAVEHDGESAVWEIVETWNTEADDDGVPFRDRIFAVFPGIEPSFNTGAKGLHLQFLFDPEIGKKRYLGAAALLWKNISPWNGKDLRVSQLTVNEAIESMGDFRAREGGVDWRFLVLAPHVDRASGLFEATKGELLSLLDHEKIAALEMGDHCLPDELVAKKGEWFTEGLARYRQGLHHASDAYAITGGQKEHGIGHRFTWLKLAEPRIEALRQAFVASDSRLRTAYHRDPSGACVERPDAPDATSLGRTWIRRVTIEGGASFFGGKTPGGEARTTTFDLSPDLTCIIGGSMTGKSTLLDGLRMHLRPASLPLDKQTADRVSQRGNERFLAGGARVGVDVQNRADASWPPTFFSQNELHRFEGDALEAMLRQLVPELSEGLDELHLRIGELDEALVERAGRIDQVEDQLGVAEQRLREASDAQRALGALQAAGHAEWEEAARREQGWRSFEQGALAAAEASGALYERVGAAPPPSFAPASLAAEYEAILERTHDLSTQIVELVRETQAKHAEAQGAARERRVQLERSLVEQGRGASELQQLKTLTNQAKHRSSFEDAHRQLLVQRDAEVAAFQFSSDERSKARSRARKAMAALTDAIAARFDGAVRIDILADRRSTPLEQLLSGLGQRGITQWCNGRRAADGLPSPEALLEGLRANRLDALGMSEVVQERFREAFQTASAQRRLAAVATSDAYAISYKLDDGTYRRLEELSGGQRVGVLLTLLLESSDRRPLVIDQPEDELDNRFLSHTLLPALRRVKGKRQIIFATHNANLVVNGDADQVIQLEADANHGRVAVQGAIEDAGVRRAILETVDGGQEAFRMRRLKYGF